jgi:protein-arginine kinase activator protein McsA
MLYKHPELPDRPQHQSFRVMEARSTNLSELWKKKRRSYTVHTRLRCNEQEMTGKRSGQTRRGGCSGCSGYTAMDHWKEEW